MHSPSQSTADAARSDAEAVLTSVGGDAIQYPEGRNARNVEPSTSQGNVSGFFDFSCLASPRSIKGYSAQPQRCGSGSSCLFPRAFGPSLSPSSVVPFPLSSGIRLRNHCALVRANGKKYRACACID
ncbi:uncharacterized protein N7477_000226 [Penicillium maclennaniae]|uniref:uncharacterized protein n=1 Tax=Penicillium maclennaniae TaxID=1343394 RepID=UPI0025406E6E|nr:uncharacterized protein N7477_000226 [Penicillium maclennaniae]KAJ5683881.1 hypothetical protein N7477_000226 [Penicillium maclennaniae]